MPRKRTNECVSKRKALSLFAKRVKNARTTYLKKEAGPGEPMYGGADVKDVFKSIIKELSFIRKTDGLVMGTNEVLRLLEKEKLAVVFLSWNKASLPIKGSLFQSCRQASVPFIRMDDKDLHTLGTEFPKSITYGIKKESLATLENLRILLQELAEKRTENKDEIASSTNASCYEKKHQTIEEIANQKVLDVGTFYHSHNGHLTQKYKSKETGFVSLSKYSFNEKETDFLNYDSIACSGTLSIK